MNYNMFPLTSPQKSIWDIESFYRETSYSSIATTIYIKQRLDLMVIQQAINIVIQTNDALRLRLRFRQDNTQVDQYVNDFRTYSLDAFDFIDKEEDSAVWEQEMTRTPFRLLNSDMYMFALIRLKETDALYVKVHHLIADAWSVTLLVHDIFDYYYKLKKYLPLPIQGSRPSYIDFITEDFSYLNTNKFLEHRMFWQRKFSALPEVIGLGAPKIKPGATAARLTFQLSSDQIDKMKKFTKAHSVSNFILFFALFSIYISKTTASRDFVIGTPILNRANAKQRNTLGMFINNVPFRIQLNNDCDFLTYLKFLSGEWKKILKNYRYPYNMILKDFRETHRTSRNLIDFALSYQNAAFNIEHYQYDTKWHFNGYETNTLMLHISDRDASGTLTLDYDYSTEAFGVTNIEEMHNQLLCLLDNAIKQPHLPISKLPMLSAEDLTQLFSDFNSTTLIIPQNKTIHRLFEDQVQKNPDRIALICKDKTLTYSELNSRANRLAALLRSKGVCNDLVVGIISKRSLTMIISILAVLKAGGAYLPIDPSYPPDRIQYMLGDSQAKILLGQTGQPCPLSPEIDFIDPETALIGTYESRDLLNINKPSDLAYIIYTSGSTGNPKGVMIEHKSVVNFIYALTDRIDFSQDKTMVSVTTVSFDIFVMETILPLTNGLKVVIATEEEQISPDLLFDLITRNRIEMIQLTPSRLQLLLKSQRCLDNLRNLTEVFIGGEALKDSLLKEIRNLTKAKLYNMYGPTETTIWSTFQDLTSKNTVDLGKPIGNTEVYILDSNKAMVPPGICGELYIAGKGLARGYLNRPELTKHNFIDSPFKNGDRLYKTGDIARWKIDGTIEYVGRNDQQVKIRGYRIELGEIENCLLNHAGINEAVVSSRIDKNEKPYLCAYLVGHGEYTESALANFLTQYLPEYMIPARFVWLKAMPLTPSGKVDKNLLPEPQQVRSEITETALEPKNEIERQLLCLWSEVLDARYIGPNDNFFRLGGDSLDIVEILTAALPYNWALTAQDFYECPTIRQLAAKISGHTDLRSCESTLKKYPRVDECYAKMIQTQVNTDPIRTVLLTGATGFLGIHVLFELLQTTDLNVYCLVRSSNLTDTFKYYFPTKGYLLDDRVKIIYGDITMKNLGLSESAYQDLKAQVNIVIHSAALVKHYGDYQEFEKVNIESTENVIEFCFDSRSTLNHISTISVMGDHLICPHEQVFTENDLYIGQNYLDNVYVRSKFEAECKILEAVSSGLQCTILRVGILTGRYSDGFFQKNITENAFYNTIRSLLSLHALSTHHLNRELDFTPVDYCAKGLVKIVLANARGIFHLLNPQKIPMDILLLTLYKLGFSVEVLPPDIFGKCINETVKTHNQRKLLKGLILDPQRNDAGSSSPLIVDSLKTQAFLKDIGFEWPTIDTAYLSRIIDHMQASGFLKDIDCNNQSSIG